jgi:aldose 1-epimerase
MIELAAGPWRATLRPEIGGCLAALTRDGVPVLRTMACEAAHALESACFPLVPYCNRIADGRFIWRGERVDIAPNLPPHPHPLHGLGWLAEWRVVRNDRGSALLEHAHDGTGEWPWAYLAHQHIALDPAGLTLRLMVQNRAPETAPIGLGLHPYFRRARETVVTFAAEGMLGIDSEFLPDGARHPADAFGTWSKGAALPAELVDHCFTSWSGTATIADNQGTITLRGFGGPHCHVYAPPGREELCIEPVNHTPDALNRAPGEMALVPPGCASGIAMRIEASAAG